MHKKFFRTLFLTMLAGAVTAVGMLGFTACEGTAGKDGKSAYDIWLEQGNTGTEQDFLDSLKGDRGEAPEITVGSNGHWFVDGVDTGVKAQGDNGFPGNKIYNGKGKPAVENAVEGDMYIDTDTWNVYFYAEDKWTVTGNLKGEIVKSFSLNVTAGSTAEMPIDLEAGFYVIEADLGSAELTTGKLQAKVESNTKGTTLFAKSQTRSDAAGSGHNIYYGYIIIGETDTNITFSAIDEDVTAEIALSAYEQPILEADGKPVEVPVNSGMLNTAGDIVFKISVGNSITAGDYTLSITKNKITNAEAISIFDDVSKLSDLSSRLGMIRTSQGTATLTIGELAQDYLIIRYSNASDTFNYIDTATITLTANK